MKNIYNFKKSFLNLQLFADNNKETPEFKESGLQEDQKKSEQIMNNNIKQRVNSYEAKIKKARPLLPGISTTTLRVGLETPTMYKEILAGEYIKEWNIKTILRLLTPLVPTMHRAFLTLKAFFVPNTRVMLNWEKYKAGSGQAAYNQENPNATNATEFQNIPTIGVFNSNTNVPLYDFSLLNYYGIPPNSSTTIINILPLRGYRAIYNDFLRNKEYQVEIQEYKGNTADSFEAAAILTNNLQPIQYYNYNLMYGQTRNGYLTNIKKNMTAKPSIFGDQGTTEDISIYGHLDWQTEFQDLKQRQNYSIENDWDIIAKMGGTKPVITDRTQFLGKIDIDISYQQISQTARDTSSPLGTTGSFSYSVNEGTIIMHKEFLQDGYIHILAQLNIDKLYEESTPKELLKTKIIDFYRPGLAKKEAQVLLDKEIANNFASTGSPVAFQPPWAEYKRMPNLCTGYARSNGATNDTNFTSFAHWHYFASIFGNTNTEFTINDRYFQHMFPTLTTMYRNNAFELTPPIQTTPPFAILMQEHCVETALPIDDSIFTGNSKAEETR